MKFFKKRMLLDLVEFLQKLVTLLVNFLYLDKRPHSLVHRTLVVFGPNHVDTQHLDELATVLEDRVDSQRRQT